MIEQNGIDTLADGDGFYRSLFEQMAPIALIIDPESGAILQANPAASDFYGYSLAELTCMQVFDLALLPADKILDLLQQAANRKLTRLEVAQRLANGEIREVEVHPGPVSYQGRPLVLAIVHEITQRKQLEQNLLESEQRFRGLTDSMQEGVLLIGSDWRYLYINPVAEVQGQRPKQELLGRTVMECWPGIEANEFFQVEQRVMQDRTPETVEGSFPMPDGRLHWFEWRIEPALEGLLIITTDITERKQAEQRLVESEEKWRGLFEILPVGVSIVDPRHNVTTSNPALSQILELSEEALQQGKYRSRRYLRADLTPMPPEEFPSLRAIREQTAVRSVEIGVQLENDRIIWTSVSATPLFSGAGSATVTMDITGRKQAELALKASEQDLRQILDATPGLIWSALPDGFIDYLNDGWLSFTGMTQEQARGTGWMQALHPDDLPDTGSKWAEATHTGCTFEVEQRLRAAGGQYHWFLTRARPVLDAEGRVLKWYGLNIDITARKQAEADLRRAKAELVRFFDLVPDMVCIASSDGYLKDVNAEWERSLGYACEELLEKPFAEFIHPDDREATFREVERQIQGEATIRFTNRYLAKDGAYRWLEWNATPSPDGVTLYAAARDVTGRKQAEAALRAAHDLLEQRVEERTAELRTAQEKLNAAIQAARVGLWDWDFSSDTVYYSPEYKQLLGYADHEIPNEFAEWEKRIHLDDHDQALAVLDAYLRNPATAYWNEFRMQHKDGGYRWMLAQASLANDSYGRPQRMLGSLVDITELKLTQQSLEQRSAELQVSNLALERALKARDEFLAAMSHELRTPLAGILGMADALEMMVYGDLNLRQHKAVQAINTSGRRLLAVINDVLDFSALQSGEIYLENRPCSLSEICQNGQKAVKSRADTKRQVLAFRSTPDAILLNTDCRRLQQALTSLLDNAVKFTPEDGRIEVVAIGMAMEKQVWINVRDTGIGIQADDLPRLFQPFVQLDARLARKYEGTGLGLALVKALVEGMSGRVEVQSVFGQGSNFTIILPWEGTYWQ